MQGEARSWGKGPPRLILSLSAHIIPAQAGFLNLLELLSHLQNDDSNNSSSQGLHEDQTGEKGCEKIT